MICYQYYGSPFIYKYVEIYIKKKMRFRSKLPLVQLGGKLTEEHKVQLSFCHFSILIEKDIMLIVELQGRHTYIQSNIKWTWNFFPSFYPFLFSFWLSLRRKKSKDLFQRHWRLLERVWGAMKVESFCCLNMSKYSCIYLLMRFYMKPLSL